MGLHKAIIPFYPIGKGYKKDFKEAAAVAVAPATAKMPNFIKLPQPASKSGLDEEDGNERIQFNCAAGRGEFRCCT